MTRSRPLLTALATLTLAAAVAGPASAQTAAETSQWIATMGNNGAFTGSVLPEAVFVSFDYPCNVRFTFIAGDLKTVETSHMSWFIAEAYGAGNMMRLISSSSDVVWVEQTNGDGDRRAWQEAVIYLQVRDPAMKPRFINAFNSLAKACGGTGPVNPNLH